MVYNYNKFAETTGNIAGNLVNSKIHESAIAASGIPAPVIAFSEVGDTILGNMSCQFDAANWMFENHKFNIDNVQISREYCSKMALLDAIPTFSTIQAVQKDLWIESLKKTPDELYIYDNRNFGDLSVFEKITHVMNHGIYATQAVAGSFYDTYNSIFGAVGNAVSYVTTNSMIKAHDWFKTEDPIANNLSVNNLSVNNTFVNPFNICGLLSEEIYWNKRFFSMPYTANQFQLVQNNNYPCRFSYHYSTGEPRYFEWSVSFTNYGLNISIAGNPLALTDREHNFNINGFKGTCYSEGHISHWKYQQAARIDDDFLDIHVITKNYHGSKARNAAEAEYYRQAKIRFYQVTGLPHELINPNRKKPTIRYEKAVENLLIKILMNKWIAEKKLSNKERAYYEAILRQDKEVEIIKVNGKDVKVYEVDKKSKDFDYEETQDGKTRKFKKYVKKELTYFDLHCQEDIITFVRKWIKYWQTGEDDAIDPGDILSKEKNDFLKELKKRETEGNDSLTRFENAQKALAENHQGEYTRMRVIYDINKEILKYDVSAENVFLVGKSAGSSLGMSSIAYCDIEFEELKRRGFFDYSKYKTQQFGSFYAQNYISTAVTNHLTTSIGLMSFADKWSDDFMNDWVAPNIGATIGTSISAVNCLLNDRYDKMNMGEKIQMITENTLRVNISTISKYFFPNGLINFGDAFPKFMPDLVSGVGLLLATRLINWAIFKDNFNYDLAEINQQLKIKDIIDNQKKCDDFCKTSQNEWEKLIVMRKMLM